MKKSYFVSFTQVSEGTVYRDGGGDGDNGHDGNPTDEEGAPEPSYPQDPETEDNS